VIILIAGGLLICVAAALDAGFRIRMSRIGYKWALLQGGAFDYSQYHKVRKDHGWAAWPVYVMWASVICGITLLIAGFFVYFGTTPKHS